MSRVPKDHVRVAAYGEVDELNSVLGLILAHAIDYPEAALLRSIQNELFDVGADLCVPPTPDEKCLRVSENQVTRLEGEIDRLNANLQPLNSFILPGGTIGSAQLHVARTVCRRAEREAATLAREQGIGTHVISYLNRLSDALFVMARFENHQRGVAEPLWKPGA